MLICLLMALVFPVVARADVRFGSALASSASDPNVQAGAPVVAGNADGLVVAAFPGPTGGEDHIWARVKPAGAADFGAPRELSIAEASRAAAVDGTVTVAWQKGGGCMGSSVWIATVPPGWNVSAPRQRWPTTPSAPTSR